MAIGNIDSGNPTRLTATANVKSSSGNMRGFYVSSTTAGTIQFYDSSGTTTTTPVTGLIIPAIGWNTLPVGFGAGIYVVIGSTLDVTVVWL